MCQCIIVLTCELLVKICCGFSFESLWKALGPPRGGRGWSGAHEATGICGLQHVERGQVEVRLSLPLLDHIVPGVLTPRYFNSAFLYTASREGDAYSPIVLSFLLPLLAQFRRMPVRSLPRAPPFHRISNPNACFEFVLIPQLRSPSLPVVF